MDELATRIDGALREEDYDRQRQLAYELALEGAEAVWPWIERLITSDSDEEQDVGFMVAREMSCWESEESRALGRKWGMATADVEGFDTGQLESLARHAAHALTTSTNEDVIVSAMFAAGAQSLSGTGPGMLRHLAHPDPDVRNAIAFNVLDVEPDRPSGAVVDALVLLARDPDDDVRDWALFAIGRSLEGPIDTPETRAVLRENLDHEHGGVSYEAMAGLALLGDVEQLLEVFEYENVAAEFVEKATEIGDARLHGVLIELRDDGWAAHDDAGSAAYREELLAKALAATS